MVVSSHPRLRASLRPLQAPGEPSGTPLGLGLPPAGSGRNSEGSCSGTASPNGWTAAPAES